MMPFTGETFIPKNEIFKGIFLSGKNGEEKYLGYENKQTSYERSKEQKEASWTQEKRNILDLEAIKEHGRWIVFGNFASYLQME